MFRTPDKKGIFLPPIEVREHPQKGYCRIAAADIPAETLIERCITVKFETGALNELYDLLGGRTIFHDYVFTDGGYAYFAMGFGGIYSHDDNANARWRITHHDNGRSTVDFRARKDIKKGEEITVKYVLDSSSLWFEQAETSTASDSSPS